MDIHPEVAAARGVYAVRMKQRAPADVIAQARAELAAARRRDAVRRAAAGTVSTDERMQLVMLIISPDRDQ